MADVDAQPGHTRTDADKSKGGALRANGNDNSESPATVNLKVEGRALSRPPNVVKGNCYLATDTR